MVVLTYLAPGSPLIDALTNDSNCKYLKIDIKRPSGNKTLLLPEHPTLPDLSVVAITKSIYYDTDLPPHTHIPLHSIMKYYDYYNISPRSEDLLFHHLDSENPQVVIFLTSNIRM